MCERLLNSGKNFFLNSLIANFRCTITIILNSKFVCLKCVAWQRQQQINVALPQDVCILILIVEMALVLFSENSPANRPDFAEFYLKVETITKPLTFAEINLLKLLLNRWCMFVRSRRLLKQYFNKWREYHKMASETQNDSTATEKIDMLISELHRLKLKKKKFVRSNSELVTERKILKTTAGECFENRFKTQKAVIEVQKAKLEAQNRLIEDLKLGIIKDELSKSLEHTKTELREIFSKSSNKLKCKMAPTGVKLEDTLANFIIKSNKAPKFLQQMEIRALERAKNREIIRERKRLIDEEKQRIFEYAIEQKRIQDEEEKRKNLEAIKEKQRADLERQKIIQMNKEKYFCDLKKASRFYNKTILKRYFAGLQHNVYMVRNSILRADDFYERNLKLKTFCCWVNFIEEKYRELNDKADALFERRILSHIWQQWKDVG